MQLSKKNPHPIASLTIPGKIVRESEAIRLELKSSGCQLRKLPKKPAWSVTWNGSRFELHFLPRTNEWILLPTTPSALRDRLMLKIEKALALVRS